jgi:hypothetical protein
MTDIQTQAWLDQEDAHAAEIIRRVGWLINYVGSCGCHDHDGPPFAYTVGLFGMHHPELLLLGVSQADALGIFNTLGARIRDGETLTPGTIVTFEQWSGRIVPEEVPNPHEIVFAANRYYGLPQGLSVPVLQLSYDDPAGKFPWEPGYAAPHTQPRPGTFRA